MGLRPIFLSRKIWTNVQLIELIPICDTTLLKVDSFWLLSEYLRVPVLVRGLGPWSIFSHILALPIFQCIEPALLILLDSPCFWARFPQQLAAIKLENTEEVLFFFQEGVSSSTFEFRRYVKDIYACTLMRLKAADIDQEVKERAISCM